MARADKIINESTLVESQHLNEYDQEAAAISAYKALNTKRLAMEKAMFEYQGMLSHFHGPLQNMLGIEEYTKAIDKADTMLDHAYHDFADKNKAFIRKVY